MKISTNRGGRLFLRRGLREGFKVFLGAQTIFRSL